MQRIIEVSKALKEGNVSHVTWQHVVIYELAQLEYKDMRALATIIADNIRDGVEI